MRLHHANTVNVEPGKYQQVYSSIVICAAPYDWSLDFTLEREAEGIMDPHSDSGETVPQTPDIAIS